MSVKWRHEAIPKAVSFGLDPNSSACWIVHPSGFLYAIEEGGPNGRGFISAQEFIERSNLPLSVFLRVFEAVLADIPIAHHATIAKLSAFLTRALQCRVATGTIGDSEVVANQSNNTPETLDQGNMIAAVMMCENPLDSVYTLHMRVRL